MSSDYRSGMSSLPPPPVTPPAKPIWKRGWFWVGLVLVLGGIGTLVGDTDNNASKESAANASPSQAACPQVAQGWVQQLGMPSGTYVYADAGTASNGRPAWVVQKDDGAVWATDVDPSIKPSSGGLLVPMNDQARQDSDSGVDLTRTQVAGLFPDASVESVSACG
jgi:hypothetical protein